ncbi:MAG: RNA-binding transcriptional accessory protein [Spirochaetes bacterium]|nr:RNA-binding transcriptional accessory protein [Spirochaetota bacterium]
MVENKNEKKKLKIRIKKENALNNSSQFIEENNNNIDEYKKNENSNLILETFDQKVEKKEYPLEEPAYDKIISQELNLKQYQVKNTINLLNNDNTIPFIARYRKEMTGSLDEVIIREIDHKYKYLKSLYQRKKEVLSSILTQGKLNSELEKKILDADKISVVEELYLPFKPKKKTKGMLAKELGLEPLAIKIKKESDPFIYANEFIDPEKGIKSAEDAIKFASYIIMEEFSNYFEVRNTLKNLIFNQGEFNIKKKTPEEIDEFDMYKDYKEPVKTIKNHRILAINRGEKKDKLIVKIVINDDAAFEECYNIYKIKEECIENKYLRQACLDGYKKSLFSSIENLVRNELTERAEKEAIDVFSKNLENLLMTPPLKNRKILAIDPGIRTGSKIAILNSYGDFVDKSIIYQENENESISKIVELVEQYNIELIAIGNGTASREVESIVAKAIKENNLNCKYIIVAETGASVYSASDIAREEFPDLDVTIRGAISIGRRVLDPLSEFVKIDPKSLGVGQYQHDVNQKILSEKLDEVVEMCVNKVGVLLNTASISLLKYVSGISSNIAKAIVEWRKKNGPFKSREDLLKVPGFGIKTFEQAAGFLRIPESNNFLDNSWVHPESYQIALEILKLQKENVELTLPIKEEIAKKYGKGIETINDIIEDLKKPGRDPREDIIPPILKEDITKIEDLKVGMKLKGTVRNVTKFGAFVDIGLKNDALVHISQICDKFVDDPLSKVHVGQIVDVIVIDIDKERGRVSLSMKDLEFKEKSSNFEVIKKKENRDIGNKKIDNKEKNILDKKSDSTKVTLGDLFKNIKIEK